MGKLVRDRIPEIIKNDGKTPIILTEAEPFNHVEYEKITEKSSIKVWCA